MGIKDGFLVESNCLRYFTETGWRRGFFLVESIGMFCVRRLHFVWEAGNQRTKGIKRRHVNFVLCEYTIKGMRNVGSVVKRRLWDISLQKSRLLWNICTASVRKSGQIYLTIAL